MMDQNKYSAGSKAVMQLAFRKAWELGQEYVGSGHILLALSEQKNTAAGKALREVGLERTLLRDLLVAHEPERTGSSQEIQYLYLSADGGRILELAEAQMGKLSHKMVEPEHILLGMLQEKECAAHRMVVSAGADPEKLVTTLLKGLGKTWPLPEGNKQKNEEPGEPKTLEKYSRDLTAAAREDSLDPVIGREDEVQRVVQILSRRTKNNPVLVGEPGVGKTAIAEGLAQRIVAGDVPETLLNRRVLNLDLTRMVAGTKYRGEFEERLTAAIEEAVKSREIILFIDELHTLIGAGASEGSMDAANILKPALGRGELQVIGATTLGEYRKHIEKDSALERRFQPVQVEEPDTDDTVAILKGLRQRYEEHHKLTITDEAIEDAVRLSQRYIQDRFLPDKAIDLMDEAAARVRTQRMSAPGSLKDLERRIAALEKEKQEAVSSQDYEQAALMRDRQGILKKELEEGRNSWMTGQNAQVTGEDVAQVVSSWTGVPVTMLTQDESQRLLRLEEILHRRVVDQEEAVKAVSKAIRRGRVGLKDPKRPMGSFLFLGPTGVGKTELCKALAQAMFQDEDAMLRVDMSEFREPHSVSKLIGSPPGYVGYDEGGQLTEQVRRKPYSVILFDEIEKAHGDVWSVLLQIMEDGRLTDSQGRHVDFKHAIIVMTSNLGARNITDKQVSFGFTTVADSREVRPVAEIRSKVMEELKATFKPEFLNRIDDVIVFHQLERDNIRAIAGNMLEELRSRLGERGVGLKVDDGALELLVEQGFDPAYGARPLRRVIRSEIEDRAAEALLEKGPAWTGDVVVAGKEATFQVELLEKMAAPVEAERVLTAST